MSQKSALVIAFALTAFLMTILGALITQVSNASDAARGPAAATAVVAPAQQPQQAPQQAETAPTLDASAIKAAIAEREASYQQLLDQANKQIAEANAQMQKQAEEIQKAQVEAQRAQAQAQQAKAVVAAKPSAAPAPAKPAAPQYAVTMQQALDIAWVTTKGGKSIRAAELVEFESKAAYEFIYANGSLYIDASTAKVLFTNVDGPAGSDKSDGNGTASASSKKETAHEDEHEDKD